MQIQQIDSPAQLLRSHGWVSVRCGDAVMHHHIYFSERVTLNQSRIVKLKKVPDRQRPILAIALIPL
jgi:hypothetical protein